MTSHDLPRTAAIASAASAPGGSGAPCRLEPVLRHHGSRLLLLAQGLLGDDRDARDVLVGAFASAGHDVAPPELELEVLRRAVIERSLALLRTSPRSRMPAAALAPTFLPDGHRAVPVLPAAVLQLQVLQGPVGRRLLRAAIASLPDELRVVLILRDLERFDEAATAAFVGAAGDEVRQLLHLARHALWELLARDPARQVQ